MYNIEDGLSSLLFLTVPLMFEIPYYAIYGFITLSASSALFHTFPSVKLFSIMDTTSIVYVGSLCSCVDAPVYSLLLASGNVVEKLYFGTDSALILKCVWIYSFTYCTIKFNRFTPVIIYFLYIFYNYTYVLNNGIWDKDVRLLWHFFNTLYISINIPYRFKQY